MNHEALPGTLLEWGCPIFPMVSSPQRGCGRLTFLGSGLPVPVSQLLAGLTLIYLLRSGVRGSSPAYIRPHLLWPPLSWQTCPLSSATLQAYVSRLGPPAAGMGSGDPAFE